MYKPISIPQVQRKNSVSFMAKKGENLRDLPQLLDVDSALKIENYLLTSEGGLKMRHGYSLTYSTTGTNGMQSLDRKGWTDDLMVFGWGTTVGIYRISTDTMTTVKTDFNIADKFSGVRYGDYFHVASGGGDKIGQISFTLNYDAQSANFNVGAILTGGTSGATAIILSDSDSGATGTLTLGSISGTFQNNETITDDGSSPGSATSDGTLTFTYTELTNSPKALRIAVVGARLFAVLPGGSLQYCDIDTGTNPPFTNWNNSATATQGGKINFRAAGEIKEVFGLGETVVVLAEKGKWAFHISIIDSGGTLSKIENTDMYRLDGGGAKGALITDKGIFYANEFGIWQIVVIGQQDIPYSKQESLTSKLLGNTYFDDVDLTDCDMMEYKKENTILVTVRNNASANNYIICYNTEMGGFSRITGWKIKSFVDMGGTFYGGDSTANKIYKLFDGWTDNGTKIWTDFEQEVPTGALWTKKSLLKEYIQGKLSQSTVLDWRFSIFDETGAYKKDKLKLQWTAQNGLTIFEELGTTEFGSSKFGGDQDLAKTIESFDGGNQQIRNFQRLRVRFTGWHQAPHQINWFSLVTQEKMPIRRRKLTNIT